MHLLALTFDISFNQLLEKGIAVFFAVVLLLRIDKRMKALEAATNAQTLMFHDCLVWLGELIRRDKRVNPPTMPGLPHMHSRKSDNAAPGVGHIPDSDTPTPKPPNAPTMDWR